MIDRSGYELDVDEAFEGPDRDDRLWLPNYLPHCSSREATRARYDVGGGQLRLRIDADQPPWNPEKDGWIRVSGLQTGQSSGPVGSRSGQLHFTDGLVVREADPSRRSTRRATVCSRSGWRPSRTQRTWSPSG